MKMYMQSAEGSARQTVHPGQSQSDRRRGPRAVTLVEEERQKHRRNLEGHEDCIPV